MQTYSEAHAPAIARTKSARVLFTLSAKERGFFLAHDGALGGLDADELAWMDGRPSADAFAKLLESARPEVVVTAWSTPARLSRELEAPDSSVRYVCHCTGSVRHLVPRSFLERGGVVSNWGGLAAPPVAEHALLLALAALRNLAGWRSYIARLQKAWPVEDIGTHSLFGRTVGVHGLGAVARNLIALLRPFGVRIRAFSAGVAPAAYEALGVGQASSLRDLFTTSEVLFECEALTPDSAGKVDAPVLAALPDGAVFVNVGRSQVVVEDALLHEARSGRLRLALDVLCEEPANEESPFYRLPNVVLSPHIAGPTLDEYPQVGKLAVSNIGRFLRGEAVASQVTLEIYDRST